MNNNKYEKILKEGVRIEWYGVEVPEELITPLVKFASDNLINEVNKLESELEEYVGVTKDKKKAYIDSLINNIRNMPYTLNNDVYMIKKKKIDKELEENKEKKVTTRKKPTNRKKVTSNKSTKNSNLIFGNNK